MASRVRRSVSLARTVRRDPINRSNAGSVVKDVAKAAARVALKFVERVAAKVVVKVAAKVVVKDVARAAVKAGRSRIVRRAPLPKHHASTRRGPRPRCRASSRIQ